MNLIRHRRVATDNWLLLKAAPDAALPAVPAEGDVIVPLVQWLHQRDPLLARKGRTGVWLEAGEDFAALVADLPKLPLIALNFPKFGDGRNLSTARLLRERHTYEGELRAIGEVYRDLLLGMHRCGIDSYLLHESQDADDALRAFDELPEVYQASVEQPVPLFRRRVA
jgi:uncharacterized protein (DUF934 family)